MGGYSDWRSVYHYNVLYPDYDGVWQIFLAVDVYCPCALSTFAASQPVVNPDAAAVTQVLAYIGELLFNMLMFVGSVKMSDRIIREMLGL